MSACRQRGGGGSLPARLFLRARLEGPVLGWLWGFGTCRTNAFTPNSPTNKPRSPLAELVQPVELSQRTLHASQLSIPNRRSKYVVTVIVAMDCRQYRNVTPNLRI